MHWFLSNGKENFKLLRKANENDSVLIPKFVYIHVNMYIINYVHSDIYILKCGQLYVCILPELMHLFLSNGTENFKLLGKTA